MATSNTRLAAAIKAAILAGVDHANDDSDAIEQAATALATEILDEITSNAVVTTSVPGTGLVAPSGGGPVTGTATGTGTIS